MTVFQKLGALTAVTVMCVGFSGCCGKRCCLFGGGASSAVSAPMAVGCDTCSTTSYAQPSYSQPAYSTPTTTYAAPSYSQPAYSQPAYSNGVSVGNGMIGTPQISDPNIGNGLSSPLFNGGSGTR